MFIKPPLCVDTRCVKHHNGFIETADATMNRKSKMNIFTANNKISKSLVTFALKRGLELYFDEEEQRVTISQIDEEGEAFCEWLFHYNVGSDNNLYWGGNIYFPQADKEELPATIFTAAKLKEVIVFTAETMKGA